MARKPVLLDRWGKPVVRSVLKEEVAAATIGGVRSPISGTQSDGLNPVRLAAILRAADQGDPIQYLELAEIIEERDPHYLGVIGTRKRSVSQIDITVEAGGDTQLDLDMAELVTNWIKRDELANEVFDILDCVSKGYSFTEIIWDTSAGQWEPKMLEWRDPRWFRFHRDDLKTPMMLDPNGQEVPLDPFKFIFADIKAKSGLNLRAGLARVATWGWMFKAYVQRDWAIFSQTYGQPLRLGKYGPGASEDDKNELFNAVANIAGDCAGIIPESMAIDFVEAGNLGAASDLYEKRADWLDKQISKAVLGQTGTTDAVVGGLGSGKEHRQVQEDIERADAIALAGILNRDLIQPWIQLEYGPQRNYPRLKIAREEPEDLEQLTSALAVLVPLGLRVKEQEMREKFNLSEPGINDKILGAPPPMPPTVPDAPSGAGKTPADRRIEYPFNTQVANPGVRAPQAEEAPPAAKNGGGDHLGALTDILAASAQPLIGQMVGKIEAMMSAAGSLEELREMMLAGFDDLDSAGFEKVMAQAMMAAEAGGRAAQEDESV